jgi:tripartite-type tricarboxylate transporter receptor subunit TctC
MGAAPKEIEMKYRYFATVICMLALLALTGRALASAYPERPIRFIVPYPAGGPTDAISRALAEPLQAALGQPVVIENRAGAGGNIGVSEAAHAAKDGYTLVLLTTTNSAINPTLYGSLPYDPEKDIRALAILARASYVLVARNEEPPDLKDLLSAIKVKSGKLNAAYSSTTSQIGNAMLKTAYGLQFADIPYKGDAEAINALMAGDVDFYFTVSTQLGSFVDAHRFQALAAASPQRNPLLPNTPTFAEAGFPAFFDLVAWYGVGTTAGTPDGVVKRLNAEITKILASETFKIRLKQMGLAPAASLTPDQSSEFVRSERLRWQGPVKSSGATVQ